MKTGGREREIVEIELTDNHQGKVKSLFNSFSVNLIGQIRKSHVTVELLGLGRWGWSWMMKNSSLLVFGGSV